MNGISVLIKRGGDTGFLSLFSTTLGTKGEVATCKPGRGLSPDTDVIKIC